MNISDTCSQLELPMASGFAGFFLTALFGANGKIRCRGPSQSCCHSDLSLLRRNDPFAGGCGKGVSGSNARSKMCNAWATGS